MYSLITLMGSTVSSDSTASAAAGTAGGMGSSLILILVMMVAFYFLLIRPQRKRDKEARDMLAAIKKGDKIVTIGGIRGTISAVKENTVVVKVDENTKIEFNKTAISSVLNKADAPAPAAEEKKDSKKKEEIVEKPAEDK